MIGGGRIYGVDYDTTRVVVCMLPIEGDGPATTWTIPYRHSQKQDAFQACRYLRSALETTFGRMADANAAWWIEHAFGANRSVDFKLGRVQGAILACLPTGAPVNEVGPAEWKKGIGLKGNAKKDDYIPALRDIVRTRTLGTDVDVMTEHELDAFGVAFYGRLKNRSAVGV